MGKLFFTIKLPRSGGTTACKEWQKYEKEVIGHRFVDMEIPQHLRKPRVVVSPDNWRLALGFRFHYAHETVVWAGVYHAVKALLYDYDVMLDCTNTNRSKLYQIFSIDPNATYVHVETPEHICIDRAKKTNQEDLIPVIRAMAINLGEMKKEGLDTVVEQMRKQAMANVSKKAVSK